MDPLLWKVDKSNLDLSTSVKKIAKFWSAYLALGLEIWLMSGMVSVTGVAADKISSELD